MDMLQEKTDFLLTEDKICNLSPREGESPSYKGMRYNDSTLQRYREYVLIARRPGTNQNRSTITMIAANHGRAIEGAASYLTSEGEVSRLLSMMKVDRQRSPLPDRFQVLLAVEMIDIDDEIVHVEHISHRMSE
jgi:hypothetical protein